MKNEFESIFSKISSEDKESIRLLNDQLGACIVGTLAYLFLYESTYEGIELIFKKYSGEEIYTTEPDILSLESTYLFLIERLIFANVAFTRFNIVYNKAINGQFNFSIKPNVDICIANIFNIIADIYFIIGAQGIYDRDRLQPIFGI